MTPRPHPPLIAASRLVENLAFKLPIVRRHICEQIANLDGIGPTASGSDSGGGGHSERTMRVLLLDDHGEPLRDVYGTRRYDQVPVTAVEDYALRRDALANTLADFEAHAKAIATIAANALRDADRIIGFRVEVPRCDAGVGREGVLTWGRPECTEVPEEHRKMCDACRKREHRWRRDNGLTARIGEDNPAA